MPIGVIFCSSSIIIGGILGTLFGKYLSVDFKEKINMVFGACALAMGITSVMLMKNMPAVIFATVLGTTIGLIIHFGDLINRLGVLLKNLIFGLVRRKESDISDKEYDEMLLTIIVLFCAGGTGIYGSIVSGMSGDHTLLISKAILDVFTAMIFSCLLGPVVSFIAIPQFIIFFTLFSCGGMIMPYTTPEMVDDFKAVGGIILLATSFRMIKVKMFPVADMIPAMILAMPISHIWTTYIMPML